MKKIIWIVVIILAIWGLASLGGGKVPVAGEPASSVDGPIKIGVIAPLTGPVADYGE